MFKNAFVSFIKKLLFFFGLKLQVLKKVNYSCEYNLNLARETNSKNLLLADDLTIYVFTHKKTTIVENGLYKIVGLGGFESNNTDYCDKNGSNTIFSLNSSYCELTGIYYIWRNLHLPEIIGSAHYRRYLNLIPNVSKYGEKNLFLTNEEATSILSSPLQKYYTEKLLTQYDIILPHAYFLPESLKHHYFKSHEGLGWDAFINELDNLYGKENHCLEIDRRGFWGNIFIMKRYLFDKYCEHLFLTIDSTYKKIGYQASIDKARYQPTRYPGYLAERFMTAFINANRLRYYEAESINITDF